MNKLSLSVLLLLVIIIVLPVQASNTKPVVTLVSTELGKGLLEDDYLGVHGIYPRFFAKAAERAGVVLEYRIVPWSRAVIEAEKSSNYLLFPLTRMGSREKRFSWLEPLRKTPICFISLNTPINSYQQAKALKRVLVWNGSSHQQLLYERSFTNILAFKDPRIVAEVLRQRPNSAWYAPCHEGLALLTHADLLETLRQGEIVDNEVVWLVGGKNYVTSSARQRFLQAVDELNKEGMLENLFKE